MESGELEPVHEVEEAARVAACRNLDDALTSARSVGGEVAELADAVGAVADMIAWRARRDAERLGPEFVAGHADTRILRSTGDRDVVIGLSLLAPHVRYPDHEHPPEEVYVVLSAGEWWHESGAWHEPGAGGVVYTPPGTSHAMRSSGQPLLAVWFQVGTSTGAQRVGSPG